MDSLKTRTKQIIANVTRISTESQALKKEDTCFLTEENRSLSCQVPILECIQTNGSCSSSSSDIISRPTDPLLPTDVDLTELVPVNLESPGNIFSSSFNDTSLDLPRTFFDESIPTVDANNSEELGLFTNQTDTEHSYCFDDQEKNCEIIELPSEQLHSTPLKTSTYHNNLTHISNGLNASVVVGKEIDDEPFSNLTFYENECGRPSSDQAEDILQQPSSDDVENTIPETVEDVENTNPDTVEDVENTNPEIGENRLPVLEGRPKRGRKLKYENQNRETRKRLCIQNKDYFTQRNVFKESKDFRRYICPCKCLERVSEENAKKEFDKFYSVDSHDAQRALICSMVQELDIKRKRVKTSNKRKCSRLYKICGMIVCKTFFLQTLRISSCKVNSALKSMKRSEGVRDCRGVSGGKNKIDDSRVKEVIGHIQKFPKYKSHYRRANTEREFLTEDTTVEKMHQLYSAEVNNPVSLSSYKKIFLTKFNLRRKKLKKDTCNLCDRLEVEIKHCVDNVKLQTLKVEKDLHLENAEKAQDKRKEDMLTAKNQPDVETFCFDLQKTLPLPKIPTNIVYYKRQLCVYNLGIHSGKNDKGHCYVWVEGEAGRGAQEVGSCLKKHIEENVTSAKRLILWSDSCGGQNRNIKIVLMLKTVLENHPTLEQITLRYLFPGHSFLPNDSDFGDIECALKFQQRLYTVEDYMNVMKISRKKNALVVHRMEKKEFFGTQTLEKQVTNRKIDTNKCKVNWLETRELEIRKDTPLSIFMKSYFEQDTAVELSIQKLEKKGRPSSQPLRLSDYLVPLWPGGKPISKPKLEDLKSLLPLIPKDARPVFRSLFSDNDVEDDIDGFNGQLDFEVEVE